MEIIYTLFTPQSVLDDAFTIQKYDTRVTVPDYNIRPGKLCKIIYAGHARELTLTSSVWGLELKEIIPQIPQSTPLISINTLNKSGNVSKLLQRKRCLVPANGMYLTKTIGEVRLPFYIRLLDRSLFLFAGIYDKRQLVDGTIKETFALITCKANALIQPLSAEMPVILKNDDYERWLDPMEPELDYILEASTSYPSEKMAAYRVGNDILKPEANTDTLIKPVTE